MSQAEADMDYGIEDRYGWDFEEKEEEESEWEKDEDEYWENEFDKDESVNEIIPNT